MTGRKPFEYAVVRVMPRVERGEFVNAGVIVYCQDADFLAALTQDDPARWVLLHDGVDVRAVSSALAAISRSCDAASPDTGAEMSVGQRFRWLTAPRSTVVQTSPVHTGLTADPAADLHRLFAALVG